jgi:predicted dehydrogenase
MRSPLGVGLLADQGGSAHVAGVLTDHPHVHLRWVVPAAGDTTAHGAVFPAVDPGRLDALLVDDDLDVVVVDAPLHRRGEAVRDALEADKHVLVLGPLAGSLGQAEELVQVAAARGRHLAAHAVSAFRPGAQRLASLLDRGALGEIHYIEAFKATAAQDEPSIIWGIGSEPVAFVLGLLGDEPIELHGESESFVGIHADLFRARLTFATGISAHLVLSRLHAGPVERVTVVGGNLTAVLEHRPGNERLELYGGTPARATATGRGEPSLRPGDVLIPALQPHDPVAALCDSFIAGVRSRFEPQSGREAAAVVGVLESLQHSETRTDTSTPEPGPLRVVHLPVS